MVKSYNLDLTDLPDDLWARWKETFPKTQSINDRLIELIREDVDG